MREPIILEKQLLISEGATRRCYHHPHDENKCLKIAKTDSRVNEQDLKAYLRVRPTLQHYIAQYDESLAETNLGKALASELIRDHDGSLSQSFAEYRRTIGAPQFLTNQFTDFFEILRQNNLFFYDFNPKNFLIQKTTEGIQLRYTDLKSLGRTRTLVALEHIPFFAKRKLKRRIKRFMERYVYPAAKEAHESL